VYTNYTYRHFGESKYILITVLDPDSRINPVICRLLDRDGRVCARPWQN
jgi:hypothetical protein